MFKKIYYKSSIGVCQLSAVTSCIITARYLLVNDRIWTWSQPLINRHSITPYTADNEYQISLNSVHCGQMHTRCFVQTDCDWTKNWFRYRVRSARTGLTLAKWWRHATPAAHTEPSHCAVRALQLCAPPIGTLRNYAFAPSVFAFSVTVRTVTVSLYWLSWLVSVTET